MIFAARHPPVLAGLVFAVLATACARPPAIEEPPPPPGLETLEAAIQTQYRELRAAFEATRQRPGASTAEVAQAAGELGRWYHVYHFHSEAEVAYRGAQALAEDDPRWPYYRAHLARRRGDLEAAVTLFSRALELAPDQLAPRVWLAETHWQAGRAEAAEEGFAAALARDPRCVRALAGQARTAAARGDAAAAVELYRAALAEQPQAAALRYALGLAYRELGDLERAAAELSQVPATNRHQVTPALDDPWMEALGALQQGVGLEQSRGRRAFESGRFAVAAGHFRRAVAADPDNLEARINLALTLERVGKPAAAIAAAEAVVERAPDFARGHFALAGLLINQRRFADARRHLEAAVAADPDYLNARFNLAQLARGQGRLDDALAHYEAVRRQDPRMAPALHGHALTLLWLGRSTAARAALEEDLRRLPGEHDLSQLLARLLAAAPEAAARDGARALELAAEAVAGDASLTAAETWAMALAEVGRWTEAVAWQRAALAATEHSGRKAHADLARRRLELYLDGRPCREPWARGEAVSPLPVERPGGRE